MHPIFLITGKRIRLRRSRTIPVLLCTAEAVSYTHLNSQQVLELAKYGLGASTIAPDVIEGLIKVDAAVLAVDAFTRDFEELCGQGSTMLNI